MRVTSQDRSGAGCALNSARMVGLATELDQRIATANQCIGEGLLGAYQYRRCEHAAAIHRIEERVLLGMDV